MAVHVIVVVGTRPEAIKMLPVIVAMKRRGQLTPIVVSTGQHGPTVRDILALGGADIDVDLGVTSSGSLNEFVGAVMREFERFCLERFATPDGRVNARSRADIFSGGFPAGVLVHGDTSSAMAAAMAAFHLRIPVGHVEAGLRTGSILAPFPEELNRQVISRIATFHLAPTDTNEERLIREGIDASRVFITGNTGIDTLMLASQVPSILDPPLAELVASPRPLVVVTAHRRENWNGGLARIGRGVRGMVEQHPDVHALVVTHPNPAARAEIADELIGLERVTVVGPLDYVPFAQVLGAARFAISDSGGVQEEAPALGTPVLVTRETTERQEGVDVGTLRLVGTTPETITAAALELLEDEASYRAMADAPNPYGDGRASERVVAALEHLAGRGDAPAPFGAGFDRLRVLLAGGYDWPEITERDVLTGDVVVGRET
jgi:UDP-N-acetylglucosamine 2-epimerase (non-hydrolysing)